MTNDEPTRLTNAADVPADVRALLRDAAEVPPMTDADRASILAALVAPAPAPAPAPHPGPAAPMAAKPLLIAGVTVVAAVAVLAVVIARRPTEPSVSAPPAPTTIPRMDASAAPEEIPSTAPPIEKATPSATPSTTPSTRAVARPQASTVDTLAAENALIRTARSQLDTAPADALASLEEHARRFPTGALAPERDYLFVKALRRLGRVDEARTRARVYAKKHPSSPYTPAVQTILGELGGP